MRMIDRSSPVPLYHQIKQILIEELQAAQHEPGKPFLTEDELIQRFRVSRAPIRQALKQLVDDGYIYRERSKGTFPVSTPISNASRRLGGLVEYIRAQGLNPRSRVSDIGRVRPPEHVRQLLGPDSDGKVFGMTRVILLDDHPLVQVRTYLLVPDEFAPTRSELEKADSVVAILEQRFGRAFPRGEQQIWATAANADDAAALGVPEGAPILVTETTIFTREGFPVGWSRAVHRADSYRYVFPVTR